MEFVSSESGQALQFISSDEVRPVRGGIFIPDLLRSIVARYGFQVHPDRLGPNQAIKFEYGAITLEGTTILVNSLDIYSDGISVTSTNTSDADAALDDLIKWMGETYELRHPTTILPRRYQSKIVFEMNTSAGALFIKAFQTIGEIVTKTLGSNQALELTQINIGPNPPTQYPYIHTWVLQPRIAQPYVANRYFSAAPLSTDDHFGMLQKMETALLGAT